MRVLPSAMTQVIAAGDFTGDKKATTRVTIQKIQLGLYPNGQNVYASPLFPTAAEGAMELPNLKSLSWQRSIDSEISSMSMELFNTRPLPPGMAPDTGDAFDLLGYYTYNRGRASQSPAWGHTENEWQNLLVPDRLVRVYQGYGADYRLLPENDPNLVLTGVWLIDDVTYSADGLISVECRDLGRLLTDQIMFPPVVPLSQYPLKYERVRDVKNKPTPKPTTTWVRPTLETTSAGLRTQFGHHPTDAYDGSGSSYWLSEGYAVPKNPSSYVWTQAKIAGKTVGAVKVAVRGGPYRVYLSVFTSKKAGGKVDGWNGRIRIPYTKAASLPDNGSKIPYSMTGVVRNGGELTLNFPAVKGVTKVRLTFTSLHNSKHRPLPYRAAVRDIQVALGTVEMVSVGTHKEGNYEDYAQIVKRLLAYGGFYWPKDGKQVLTNSNTRTYTFASGDAYLATSDKGGPVGDPTAGRVWGDIKLAGTAGPSALGIEIWDKKPLLDGITYVKDILGYLFYIDETGAAVFRPGNVYKLGNWQVDQDGLNTTRTTNYLTIRDHEAILGLRSKLSSRNLREQVFVADVGGKIGAVAETRIPREIQSNFRRVAGWTDQAFGQNGIDKVTEAEAIERCQVMADLITIRQLFTFRTNSIRIPADPRIQIDDQVMVEERTTGDSYFHHVRSVSSQWDLEQGRWTYDLTTSWLGTDPTAEWAFKTTGLSQATKDYLAALGAI